MSRTRLTLTLLCFSLIALFGGVLMVRADAPAVNCSIPNNVVCEISDPDGIAGVRVTLDTALGEITVVEEKFRCETNVTVSWDPIVPNYDLDTEDCDSEVQDVVWAGGALYQHTGGVNMALADGSVRFLNFDDSGTGGASLPLPQRHSWQADLVVNGGSAGGSWSMDITLKRGIPDAKPAVLHVTDGISLTASFPVPTHNVEIYDEGRLVFTARDVPNAEPIVSIPEGWCDIFDLLFDCITTFSFHPDPFHGRSYYEISMTNVYVTSYQTGGSGDDMPVEIKEADEIRFIANPDGGPIPTYDGVEIRGTNLPLLEVFDTVIAPPPLTEQTVLPIMIRPGEPPDPYGLDELTAFMEAEHEVGERLQIDDQLVVEVVAEGRLIEEEVDAPGPFDIPDEGLPDPEEPPAGDVAIGRQALRVFNTNTKLEYEITVGGDLLQELHALATAGSSTGASEPGSNGADPALAGLRRTTPGLSPAPNSLSDGFDNRVLLTSTTSWPWRTIVHFSNGCSGTLIGPRHIVTSAHCVVQRGTNNWYSFTVSPGRNGGDKPYGDADMDPNPQPGDPFRWYYTPAEYRDPSYSPANCAAPCWAAFQWDWALIIIPEHLGYQTGWMGYVARPASQLNPQYHYNRGYPVCNGGSNAPDPCTPASLYGDTGFCDLGNYSAQGPDGWNRIIRHDCDTSGGHSGSAVYHYFYDSNLGKTVPVVAMVHGWGHCGTCDADDDFPNSARRLRPADVNVISFFRNWKP